MGEKGEKLEVQPIKFLFLTGERLVTPYHLAPSLHWLYLNLEIIRFCCTQEALIKISFGLLHKKENFIYFFGLG